jgi:hypothetical protein
MPDRGARSKWPSLIANVAIRLHCSTNEVRQMLWCDFREVLRGFGVKVRKTPEELAAELERFIHGTNNRNRNGRR